MKKTLKTLMMMFAVLAVLSMAACQNGSGSAAENQDENKKDPFAGSKYENWMSGYTVTFGTDNTVRFVSRNFNDEVSSDITYTYTIDTKHNQLLCIVKTITLQESMTGKNQCYKYIDYGTWISLFNDLPAGESLTEVYNKGFELPAYSYEKDDFSFEIKLQDDILLLRDMITYTNAPYIDCTYFVNHISADEIKAGKSDKQIGNDWSMYPSSITLKYSMKGTAGNEYIEATYNGKKYDLLISSIGLMLDKK